MITIVKHKDKTTVDNTNIYTIPELKTKIKSHFKQAQCLYSTIHHINYHPDKDPDDLLLISEDYRSGIMIIDSLVSDDAFMDRESFDVVLDVLNRYHDALTNNYPMTARTVAKLLSDMNVYRTEHYDY